MYEELVAFHPSVPAYGLYLAQALYKAGLYPEAERAAQLCDDDGASPEVALRVAQLQVGAGCELLEGASSIKVPRRLYNVPQHHHRIADGY